MSVDVAKDRNQALKDIRNNLPQELKEIPQWLLWIKGDIDKKTGKFKKIPAGMVRDERGNLKIGMGNFPLITFDEAYNHLLKNKATYKGLGFHCINGIVGIDIDNCFDESGHYNDMARDIIDTLNTYTERSPSGRGLRLFLKSNNPPKQKIYENNIGLEIFHNSNFFTTVTGAVENYADVEERTKELDLIINKYLSHKKENGSSELKEYQKEGIIHEGEGRDNNLTSCVGAWLKTGTKDFDTLKSMAIAHTNARHNPPLKEKEVDRIVKSVLNMDRRKNKANEEDTSIKHLYEGCTWLVMDGKTPKVIPSALAEHIRNNTHYIFVRDNATNSTMKYWYSDGVYKLINDDELKGRIKSFIPKSMQKTKDINEVLGLIETDLNFVPIESLNDNEDIVNFKNGLLNIKTMELKKHTPEILSTIQIPCNYNPDAIPSESKYFDNFINHLTENDEEVKSLLLQFMGVALSNIQGWRMKKALFMVGAGDVGKSQLKELTHKLLGINNCSGIDLETLEARFGTSSIFNKRVIGSSDMSYATVRELKIFKLITGGDILRAEFKGQNSFEFKYKGVAWFCCNKLPKFGGDKGDWVYNRIMVVECNNPVLKKDKYLQDNMFNYERDYIVSLVIKELQKVIKNDYEYIIPEKIKRATDKYKVDNDSFLLFLQECNTERPAKLYDNCTTSAFYRVYKEWCKDNNYKVPESKKAIKETLESLGKGEIKKSNGNRYYTFTLTIDAKKEYSHVYGNDMGVTREDD